MDSRVERFLKSMNGKKIAFCGIGRSNLPLVSLFSKYGAVITVCDKKEKSAFSDEIIKEITDNGAFIKCGEDYLENLDVDIIFRAPGMYYNLPVLQEFRKRGVVVTSEMEVFFDICPCKIFALTGTDGKTTTTTICAESLQRSGKKVYKGGNIGTPLLPKIEEMTADDVCVVELSSFQLISMRRSPDVAAITNIYPDHLNVHKDMAEYIGAKVNILAHQNAFSRAVLNFDNEETKALSKYVRGNLYYFSRLNAVEKGSYLDENGWLTFTENGKTEKIVHKDDIKIPGMHNVENYLTAISVLHGFVDNKYIAEVAKTFGGVEHRIEFVRELDGVRYYNDSIATSPASVTAGLKAFNKKVIIIAGGSDKQLDYSTLSGAINEYVKVLILLGETADKIEKAVKEDKNYNPDTIKIIRTDILENAVAIAKENAAKGDVISLSPASASFDKYKDFEERGRHFKKIVGELK
ncbi:MAG: UDP-N-acetylmuramoyl-L-alanine--D-glutamate ligase [Acutalibacteraceae bacterium]|nr:UDP-N-acetylmuramoyl-L-alanine--D-glutamate ligase [Acutalibacteraceae bacterium]